MNYALRLYVTGKGSLSVQALVAVKRLCEEMLPGRYSLEIIDVLKDPARAEQDAIEATPTLVRVEPAPLIRIVGTFADRDQVGRELLLEADRPGA